MTVTSDILITGAGGFTGQHACRYFASQGYRVTALTHKQHLKDPTDDQVKEVKGDLLDWKQVRDLVKTVRPENILHLAGQNHVEESWSHPLKTMNMNFLATLYLLEAVRNEKLPAKILLIGSALQNDQPHMMPSKHPYELSKTFQTMLAKNWSAFYQMNIVIARPTNLIGPGPSRGVCSMIAEKIASMEKKMESDPITIDDPSVQRDFLDVRDAVAAYERLFQKGIPGEEYDVGSGKSRSLAEVVEAFQSLTSVSLPQYSIQEKNTFSVNIENIRQLGWKPVRSFPESLKDVLSYYRIHAEKEEA